MLRNLDNKGGPTIFPKIGHVIGTVFTIALPTPTINELFWFCWAICLLTVLSKSWRIASNLTAQIQGCVFQGPCFSVTLHRSTEEFRFYEE